MISTIFAVSADAVTSFGLYIILPIFIGTLIFIMFDLSKKSDAGSAGTFWIFVALGAGFAGFIFKLLIEIVFDKFIL